MDTPKEIQGHGPNNILAIDTVRDFNVATLTMPLNKKDQPPFLSAYYAPSTFCVCMHAQSLRHVQPFATPWTIQSMEFSRQDTGVGSLSLLQGIFPTQGSNPGFDPHCRWILQLSHKGSLLKSFIFKILKEKENSELLLFLSSFSCYSSK